MAGSVIRALPGYLASSTMVGVRQVLFVTIIIAVWASWGYWLCAWIATRSFLRARSTPQIPFTPSVSILKPVKGVDAWIDDNFASFCRQDYSNFEILFGVADAGDPVMGAIERAQLGFPETKIRRLAIPSGGTNPKSSILARLSAAATGEILVISDADIRVGGDYLRRVVTPLADPTVGLVTCLYRGTHAQSFAAKLESLHMGPTFLPSVVLAHEWLGNCVGLGATLAVRKADLHRLGGYESFGDQLMDDYQLAARIRGLGLRSRLSECVVESVLGPTRFLDQWRREVRWARGIRITSPGKYLGLLLTYPLVLCALLICIRPSSCFAWTAAGLSLLVRIGCAYDLLRHPYLYLLPLREALSFAVWCAGLLGRTIAWRGQRFALGRDGRLSRWEQSRRGVLSTLVRRVDETLRRQQGIFEFSDDPSCILRASIGVSEATIGLSDGTTLVPGDCVVDLHLWNERLPRIPEGGLTLAWAQGSFERVRESLRLLAVALQADSRFAGVRAVRGKSALTPRGGMRTLRRFAERLHFELRERSTPPTFFGRLHDWGENLLIWALVRTFNPAGLRGAKLNRVRSEAWTSSDQLIAHYGVAKMQKV